MTHPNPKHKHSLVLRIFCFFVGHKWRLIKTPTPQPLIWHCDRCNWEGPSK